MTSLAPRARLLAGAVVAALAIMAVGAVGAEAKLVKVTGSTVVTPSAGAKTFLANAGVSVAPIGPATAADGKFTFPVVAGFGDTKTYRGLLAHSGGLTFTKGDRSQAVRRPVAVRVGKASVLLAQLPGLRGGCRSLRQSIKRFAIHHKGYTDPLATPRYSKVVKRFIKATKRYCSQGRVIVLARLTHPSKSVSGNTATLTAELHLSGQAARLINKVAGKKVVKAGALLGTGTSTVTRAG
jgi:hypothetical protein